MSGTVVSTQDWELVARQAEFRPAKMATLCSMSERHLQRIFKKHLQRTPSQWLRELQCRLAKQLISQGYSSKAAAAELNFATDAHFCREFKKIFGTPPQSFAPAHGISLKMSVLDKAASTNSVSESLAAVAAQ
jgi:AraC-like DNA-binding protein